ncbi:MAG TPA: EamA family transporter [Candidatus Thermoplasmatota archaeon]|nr:EamA family transporter [Candidatus Thermoplasmatota archaeon]
MPASLAADIKAKVFGRDVDPAARRPNLALLLAFGAFVVIAGINAVAVKISNEGLAPFWGGTLRFGLAGLLFAHWAVAFRLPFPRGRALVGATLFGAIGFGISYAMAYWSLLGITAGLLSVLVAMAPLLTILLASAHRLEHIRPRHLAGGGLALVGIALMVAKGIGADVSWPHLFAGLLMPIAIAESGVIAKQFPRAHPVTTNAVAMAVGTGLLFVASLVAGETHALPSNVRVGSALVYLVLVGSIAMFTLFLFVLHRWTVSATSYQAVLSPIVTILVASQLVGESVTWMFAAGAAIVLAAVYVGAVRRPPRESSTTASTAKPPDEAAARTD